MNLYPASAWCNRMLPLLIAACGGVHAADPPATGYAYVPNIDAGSISMFQMDGRGSLTLLDTFKTGSAPRAVAATRDVLYAVDIWANTLTVFAVEADGTLRRRGPPLPTGLSPEAVALDPLGRFVFVANGDSDDIQVYRIDQDKDTLHAVGRYASGDYPTDMAVDPCGRWLYVTNYAAHSVSSYAIDPQRGALTPVDTVAAGNSPGAAVVAPSSEYLYVADGLGSTLSIYHIDQARGAPRFKTRIAAPEYPYALAMDRDGRYLYSANYGSNDVTTFAIDSDGIPVKIDRVAAGIGPFSITLAPGGNHAYVANVRSDSIDVYTVDLQRGTLTPLKSVPGPRGPAMLALSTATPHQCTQ